MSDKILIIKCQHCDKINAAWICDEAASDDIGRSVVAAANRGAKVEIIDRSDDGATVSYCECSASVTRS